MKKFFKILIPLLLVGLIAASIIWYLFVYDRAFTRDTLLSQARFNDSHGNARLSSMFYDMAYTFSDHDQDVAVELANQYKGQGNFTKAEYTLTRAIASGATAELYENLCLTYVQQDKLLDAVNLLAGIPDPQIKAELDAKRPVSPKADREPGFYSDYETIHLTSTEGAAIFYTTDGTYPTTQGSVYGGSITLPAGETHLLAVAVNANGLVSPVTELNYTVTGVIEEAVFVDSAMEAAIREAISAGENRTLYTNDLWQITEFTVPDGVQTYDDLALLPQLTKLTIQSRTVNSLAPLSALANLQELDLTGSQFQASDLSVVAQLPSLQKLTLSGCGISTIADLEGANGLTYLDLSNNTVRNLDPLDGMTGLTELYLQNNAVKDLSHVGALPELTHLNISYNAVSSLEPLTGCPKLTWLEAGHNQLTNLDGVDSLTQLTHLGVDANGLTDVSILKSNVQLKDLDISDNEINSLSALKTLTHLESFNFSENHATALPDWPEGSALVTVNGSYNQLTNIDVLKRMDNLTHVYMDYNLITNIDALANNYCLVQINVFGNEIEDVSKLREHDIIVNYDPT